MLGVVFDSRLFLYEIECNEILQDMFIVLFERKIIQSVMRRGSMLKTV